MIRAPHNVNEVFISQTTSTNQYKRTISETDNGHSNPRMYDEVERLKSYTSWPNVHMSPKNLAKAGFYSVNIEDIVRCAFCNVEVGEWVEGDDAMRDHGRWSPHCAFLNGLPCGNVPIGDEVALPPMPVSGNDTCGKYGIEIRPNSFPEREGGAANNLAKLGIQPTKGPAWSEYCTFEKRLASYAEWPRSMKQKPEKLSEAGFFYTGRGDQTICFDCGGGLKYWEEHDDVWEQHAKWFSKCNFLRLQKGQDFIAEVCGRKPAVLTASEASELQVPSGSNVIQKANATSQINGETKEVVSEAETSSSSSNLCKICFAKEMGALFLPCGHIVACIDCAPALNTCAVCRKPLEATVRAFLT